MSYDFDHYSGKYLKSPVKPTKPYLARNPTAIDARAFADSLEEYERNYEAYKEDLTYFNHCKKALFQELENRLKVEYDLSQDKFDLLWMNASDRRSSEDLSQTFDEFKELYNLVNKYQSSN